MANSLRHRIGSLLLRHSPAPNLDQIHRLHRQAAGTLTSSGCKRFFSGGHDHDDIGRACEILHSFFVFNKNRSVWRNISLRLSWCWCMLGHQNTWFSLSCFNLGLSLIVRTWTLRFVETEETHKWRKITAAAYVASIGMIFYTFAGDEHEHDEHAGHAERPVMTTFCVCIARERENQYMGRNLICHLPWLICGQNRTPLLWSLG